MRKKVNVTPDTNRKAKLQAFDRLLTTMDELRENCPWDKKQTLESLRHLTIEETFELSDAILEGDLEEVRKELGDLILHIAFYSRIGSEKGAFDIADVLNGICDKLIVRHPHIYSDTVAEDEETVSANWEKIKLKEKETTSVLGGVPKSLPAQIKAIRIQEKVKGVGFEWDNKDQVWEKVKEEMSEFEEELRQENIDEEKVQQEFGDILFSLTNYARFINVNPEEALERTNKKFIRRFQEMERQVKADNKELANMNVTQMDVYWHAAKLNEEK